MHLIQHTDEITAPFKNGVITIGNFDGVHIGHQALFYEVIERANAIDGTSIAMTFEPHPLRVLKKNHTPPLITLLEQKVELIERSGVDVLICVPFTLEFAAVTAVSFVEDLLVRKIGVKAIVMGEDYAFGRNREGNIELLNTLAPRLGFEVIVTSLIRSVQGISARISSTAIRELVQAGEMQQACKMLGRHFQLRGIVVAGRDRGGKLLGFPTANLKIEEELCPKTGIYAVTVETRRGLHLGVANIGYSPTFDDRQFTVEVHILDFNEAIYGEKIRVNFVKRLRGEIKFAGIEALKQQIGKDIEAARRILMVGSLAGRA
ncbi:MAG TPA: bifunctional riboflavin kinase/FAD synthetase [Desulfobacterales bacterium]|jgi:riboflavin kinase/FMN adenylyltransferase|nr:bifunctional riboflavin kinase/FAD synthetase [Desulfobacterales bacterium]HSM89439.1 bifunctional riboflavin kinase/FAD synthetase [Desulfobacterales bacterium]